jgi:uncharacterized membrane protein
MISNHYPMTYQHQQNDLVLIAIMIAAAWIRHFFNLRHKGETKPSILVTGAIAMLAISLWISWPQAAVTPPDSSGSNPAVNVVSSAEIKQTALNDTSGAISQKASSPADSDTLHKATAAISNEHIQSLVNTHCVSCHSRKPSDDIFKVAPVGVILDTWQDIERYAPQIVRRTSVTKDMPFMNKTGMTEKEREDIAR